MNSLVFQVFQLEEKYSWHSLFSYTICDYQSIQKLGYIKFKAYLKKSQRFFAKKDYQCHRNQVENATGTKSALGVHRGWPRLTSRLQTPLPCRRHCCYSRRNDFVLLLLPSMKLLPSFSCLLCLGFVRSLLLLMHTGCPDKFDTKMQRFYHNNLLSTNRKPIGYKKVVTWICSLQYIITLQGGSTETWPTK